MKEYTIEELEYLIKDIGTRLEEKKYDELMKRYNISLTLIKGNYKKFQRKLLEMKAGYVTVAEALVQGIITEEDLVAELQKKQTVLDISDKYHIKSANIYQYRSSSKRTKKIKVKYGYIVDFFRENMVEILEIDASNDDEKFQKMVDTLSLMLGITTYHVKSRIKILREEFYKTDEALTHKPVKKPNLKQILNQKEAISVPIQKPVTSHVINSAKTKPIKSVELVTKEDAVSFLKYLEKHSNSQVCKKYGINDKQIRKYKKTAYRLLNITNINDYAGCKNQTEKLAFIEMYSKYGPKHTGEQYGMSAYDASKLKKKYCRELHIDSIKEG